MYSVAQRQDKETHGYLNVLKHDAAATLVLELHQLLGMLAFLVRHLLEVLVEAFQSHIVTVEVVGLQNSNWEVSRGVSELGMFESLSFFNIDFELPT